MTGRQVLSEADRAYMTGLYDMTGLQPLSNQEERFVMLLFRGMQPPAAAKAAGYIDENAHNRLLAKKHVKDAVAKLRERNFYDTKVTREKLTEMLFEAHSHAGNATEEILAIRELGKMHGLYAETKKSIKVDMTQEIRHVRQFEQMSDAQLARIAGGDFIAEGEFTEASDDE
jgi:phage terminase small subunit